VDGNNILSAYTRQSDIYGYDGGIFGSTAGVSFSAVEASEPTEEVVKVYLLFEGFNNPTGPGFQRFNGRILVSGDGTVEALECRLTEGDGYARRSSIGCEVGWD
jgi:hypothetical protein